MCDRMKKTRIILIAEKNQEIRDALKERIIEETPYWPLIAQNCAQATALATEESPEVVIVGDALCGGPCFNCVERLRASSGGGIQRFIVTHSAKQLLLVGRPDVVLLQKPFDPDVLLTELHAPREKPVPHSRLWSRPKPRCE